MTLVDSNVLLDIFTQTPGWWEWSLAQLEDAALQGQYRNAGGARSSVLPDFFIGAHAAVEQLPLLTRDTRRYRTYFPAVTLIAPEASA